MIRFARWDLRSVELIDSRTLNPLCPLMPLDKSADADGQRRARATRDPPIQKNGNTSSLAKAKAIVCGAHRSPSAKPSMTLSPYSTKAAHWLIVCSVKESPPFLSMTRKASTPPSTRPRPSSSTATPTSRLPTTPGNELYLRHPLRPPEAPLDKGDISAWEKRGHFRIGLTIAGEYPPFLYPNFASK